MRKLFLLSLGLAAACLTARACDLCNLYLGLNPQYNNNQVGLRWRLRTAQGLHAHTHTHTGGADDHGPEWVGDTYLSQELYARIYLNPRWVVYGALPYALNFQRDADGELAQVNGIGDMPLLVQRQLFNLPARDSNGVGQRLFVGAGVKLPLGRFDLSRQDDPHLQAGTGSWDGLLALAYLARWRQWGLATDVNYRLSTANRDAYRFANRLNATVSLFYGLEKGKWVLMPMLGAYAEGAGQDLQGGIYQLNTGGFSGFASCGLEAYRGRMVFQAATQLPVVQRLHGLQPANQWRLTASLGYGF